MNVSEKYIGLIGEVNRLYEHEGEWSAVMDAFTEWAKAKQLAESRHFEPFPVPAGGATPLTSLRVRHHRLTALLDTVGQSAEIDFNIAFFQAIEIWAVHVNIFQAAVTTTRQTTELLVDLDGPALAGNTLVTQALIQARQELESCIANFNGGNDALTSGAAVTDTKESTEFRDPILTARNPGVAGIAITSSSAALFDIHYKLVQVTRDEQLLLFALGRA